MVRRYVMVRMPRNVHEKFMNIKMDMEKDLRSFTGKPIQMNKTTFFDVLANHNENFIQVDIPKLSNILTDKRRRRNNVF